MTGHTGDLYDVVIVGAGPTGLTLANILGLAGRRVALIERNPSTVQQPRAVSIDDEALRTMQAIGLDSDVVRDLALDYGVHYHTAAGRCFLKVEPATREYGFPRRSAFSQPVLEATLAAGVHRFPGVEVLHGHECREIMQHADHVEVAISTLGNATRHLAARYLVGCDGARSAVRKAIGAALIGETYSRRWLIVDLAATNEQLRQTRAICDPDRPAISLPGPGGIRRYEFMLHDHEDDATAETPEFARRLLAACGPDADAPVVRRQVYAFHARVADRWQDRRVFIAGDAAHLSPPFAGQGMNSGVRDAHNLGWKLAAVLSGALGPGLLETYQRERAPHAAALIQLAISIGRVMTPRNGLEATLLQTGFRLAAIAPAFRDYFAQMRYKPKPFYAEGFVAMGAAGRGDNAASMVGRMLPQPMVEDTERRRQRLDDHLGSGLALVSYGPGAEAAMATVRAMPLGLVPGSHLAIRPMRINAAPSAPTSTPSLRDVDDLLAPLCRDGETVVLLVRPDRYVAALAPATQQGFADFATATHALVAATQG